MKKFLLWLLLTFLASCGWTALPEKRPDDLRIWLSESGGMVPEGHTITISRDSCTAEYHVRANTYSCRFQLTPEELDELWRTFHTAAFDRIGERTEEVYDRGGTSIGLSWGNTTVSKSDGGMSFVEGRSALRYAGCRNKIYMLTNPKVDERKISVSISISPEIFNDSTLVYLQADMSSLTGSDSLHAGWKKVMKLLPGDYGFTVNYFRKDSPRYSMQLLYSHDLRMTVKYPQQYLLARSESGNLELVTVKED